MEHGVGRARPFIRCIAGMFICWSVVIETLVLQCSASKGRYLDEAVREESLKPRRGFLPERHVKKTDDASPFVVSEAHAAPQSIQGLPLLDISAYRPAPVSWACNMRD